MNPGPQDGRRRQNHRAMAAALGMSELRKGIYRVKGRNSIQRGKSHTRVRSIKERGIRLCLLKVELYGDYNEYDIRSLHSNE